MAAYLRTLISGNKDFGGYLSVDGEKSFKIADDMIYELSAGQHSLVVYSTSDAQRKTGEFQAKLYANTSSSGVVLDTLEKASALKNLGDGWEINLMVDENQIVELSVLTKGTNVVGDPMCKVSDLDEEDVERLENQFNEWRNTPIRSKKKMIWGLILTFCGVFGLSNVLTTQPIDVEAIPVMIALAAIGVLLFVFGFKKKIRRK